MLAQTVRMHAYRFHPLGSNVLARRTDKRDRARDTPGGLRVNDLQCP